MWTSGRFVLGPSLCLSACLPVETVELPAAIRVDDFEDGDEIADPLSGFVDWRSWSHSSGPMPPEQKRFDPEVRAPGMESEAAQSLPFFLEEFAYHDYPEAALGVFTETPRDLSLFRRLRFSAKLEAAEPPPPSRTFLEVRLECQPVFAEISPDAVPVISYYDQPNQHEGVELTQGWTTYSIRVDKFEGPWWQGTAIRPEDCVRQVNGLQFVVRLDLPNLEAAAGTLWIDDVYLE